MDLSNIDLDSLPDHIKWEVIELLEDREKVIKYNKIDVFTPYKFQTDFYNAGAKYKRRFLCAANR